MATLKNIYISSSKNIFGNSMGVITSNGMIAAWGSGGSAGFGVSSSPTDPIYLSLANSRTAKAVAFTDYNTIVVCNDGSIQVAGYNQYGQLGTGNTTAVGSFTTVSLANGKLGKKAVFVDHATSFILCTDGTIQGSGTNNTNCPNVWSGGGNKTSFTHCNLFDGKTIIDIVATNRGLMVLDSDNNIWITGFWGSSYSGSLAQKTLPAGNTPKQIFGGGLAMGYVLCTNGNAYMIGYASTSTVGAGLPNTTSTLSEFTIVPMPYSWLTPIWFGVGLESTIMLTAQGLVYATGNNPGGQLGLNNTTAQTNWTQVTSLKTGRTPIATYGGNYATMIIYDDGSIQTAGNNFARQLGDGTTTQRTVFTNIMGISYATVYSTTVTSDGTAPGAPTAVSAVAGNGQAVVSFTAPADNGGSAITNYTVTASPGGATASGSASPLTVTGLTNGTTYTFTVTATNSVGTSSASSASASVIPRTVPGAPTAVSAVAGNGQAVVSFTSPANNGGSAITSYTVTASPGGATASGASSPLTVTGLTNGTAYTFTVTATNSVGTSSASSASASVTPAVLVTDLNSGNISKASNSIIVAGSRSITARKLTKSAGAVSYAPDAANKPSVAISNIPATVQDVTVGVASADASGIAVVKIVAQDAENNLITDFSASPLTVRVTLPGFTTAMVTIQTSATLGGAVTDTITGYRVGLELYEFTTTHLTYFSASAYVPCLVAGTRVLTADGYKAVEELEVGDLIRTADNRIVPFRLFTTTISATSPETAPYTIPARTFGTSPAKDLTVSPYHAIQSAPGVWQIPKYASRMFDGITQAPAGQPITYYHVELPNYFKDNLVVEGTVTESYGNKQTAGMKTVYKFNPGLNGFVRMEKSVSAKKSL